VSPVAALAALAALFGCAAARELLGARDRSGEEVSPRSIRAFPGQARLLLAALKLGLPERLARSGLGVRVSLPAVLLAKLAAAAIGGLAAWGAAPATPGRLVLLVALALPAAGFMAPDAALEREARRRHRRIVAALPDALDLLAVGASAGGDPAACFAQIARSGEGPLAAELRSTVAELSCGTPLAAALRSLRGRVAGGEIAAFCATLERSRRYGSPLAEQLHRQAVALRRAQRRTIEEGAARAAPKIQLVVALVLVPSVLLMIAAGLIANADLLLVGFG